MHRKQTKGLARAFHRNILIPDREELFLYFNRGEIITCLKGRMSRSIKYLRLHDPLRDEIIEK